VAKGEEDAAATSFRAGAWGGGGRERGSERAERGGATARDTGMNQEGILVNSRIP
jgi:hypothetical protein